MRLKLQTFIVICVLALSGCAGGNPRFYPLLSNGLHVGMTDKEVTIFIDELRQDTNRFVATGFDTIGSECAKYESLCRNGPDSSVLGLYHSSMYRYPYDVLKNVTNGTPYRYVEYWSSPTHQSRLFLFFDENTKLLKGWVHRAYGILQEPFMHEQLTSQLKIRTDKRGSGMTRNQVHAAIGTPTEIIEPPRQHSRGQHEDHFWNSYYVSAPIYDIIKELEVYSYAMAGGGVRRVYLGYVTVPKMVYKFDSKLQARVQVPNPNYIGPQDDELYAWGYDHAGEEAERYRREKSQHK